MVFEQPALSFNFLVSFYGIGDQKIPNALDIRFQKVSGIGMSAGNAKTMRIAGRKIHLPDFPEYTNLTLERGHIVGSPLRVELESAFAELKFCPRDVHIFLLDPQGVALTSWYFRSAYPTKWSVSDLDATQSSILIETIELAYSSFQTISL